MSALRPMGVEVVAHLYIVCQGPALRRILAGSFGGEYERGRKQCDGVMLKVDKGSLSG